MRSAASNEFLKNVYPIVADFTFENEFQIRSPTEEPPGQISVESVVLSKLPTNLDMIHFFLTLLKLLGQVPFCYEPKNDLYHFAWSSFGTVFSLAMALAATFGWFVYISHVVLKRFFLFGPEYVRNYKNWSTSKRNCNNPSFFLSESVIR